MRGTRDELHRQSGVSGPLEKTFLALTEQEAGLKADNRSAIGATPL